MKCFICNSEDFRKIDIDIVCCKCGCKYSREEAQKLFYDNKQSDTKNEHNENEPLKIILENDFKEHIDKKAISKTINYPIDKEDTLNIESITTLTSNTNIVATDNLSSNSFDSEIKAPPKLKAIITTVIVTLLLLSIAYAIFHYMTYPLEWVKENGYQYHMLDNGTYQIQEYTGNETQIVIPKTVRGVTVTEISYNAFADNQQIKSVVINDNITSIGRGAFYNCNSIESMVLPFVGGSQEYNKELEDIFIHYMGYKGTVPSSLKKIYILDSCTEISNSAFANCKGLREVHIPNSVRIIEDGTNLTTIGVNGNILSSNKFGHLPFYGCSTNLIIYCESYSKPKDWGNYWNYVNESQALTVKWGEYKTP